MAKAIVLSGVIRGKTITLDEATFLPEGCRVTVHLSLPPEEARRRLTILYRLVFPDTEIDAFASVGE